MNSNKNFQQQSKLVIDTLNLRKKIISLNEDVKKIQEEIKKHIYKMINLKKDESNNDALNILSKNIVLNDSKNNSKINLTYFKDFLEKKEQEQLTKDEKNKKINENKPIENQNFNPSKEVNKQTNFENLIFTKNTISHPNANDSFLFTDEEETWIPGLNSNNRNDQEVNHINKQEMPFYDWLHKKG